MSPAFISTAILKSGETETRVCRRSEENLSGQSERRRMEGPDLSASSRSPPAGVPATVGGRSHGSPPSNPAAEETKTESAVESNCALSAPAAFQLINSRTGK